MTQPGQPGSQGSGGYPPSPQGPPPPPQWQSTPQPPQPPQPGGYPPQQPGYPPQQQSGYPPQQPGYPPPPPGGYPPPPPPPAGQQMQMPAWTANIMDRTVVAGPAGYYYADVPNRIIAIIIDGIILSIANYILQAIIFAIFGTSLFGVTVSIGIIWLVVLLALQLVIDIGYFTYMWSAMRATIGLRALGMQIGDASDGHSISYNQSLRRAAALWGPTVIGQFLILAGGWLFSGLGAVLSLLGLVVAIGWPIYLLITTAQSPTKQGFQDLFAHTMVVKAARAVV
jgi:uncharacterized RDD family membrane protein YckC